MIAKRAVAITNSFFRGSTTQLPHCPLKHGIRPMRNKVALSVPLACVPGAIPKKERPKHFARAKQLFAESAKERRDLRNGCAFRFDVTVLEEVARFIENERKCCPFVTFEVEVGPTTGPLWLRMTGPDGTQAVLDAELDLSNCCGSGL